MSLRFAFEIESNVAAKCGEMLRQFTFKSGATYLPLRVSEESTENGIVRSRNGLVHQELVLDESRLEVLESVLELGTFAGERPDGETQPVVDLGPREDGGAVEILVRGRTSKEPRRMVLSCV